MYEENRLEETLLILKRQLRRKMNGVVAASMRTKGMNYEFIWGVDLLSLRGIAATCSPDAALAEALWKEPSRECKILATMLYPREALTPETADRWLAACFTDELVEQLCFNLFQYIPFLKNQANTWIKEGQTRQKSAGYLLFVRWMLKKETLPDLSPLIPIARQDSLSDHFQLKRQALRFLELFTSDQEVH
jgi:3-methyladenine DNA glycosylase AlkD